MKRTVLFYSVLVLFSVQGTAYADLTTTLGAQAVYDDNIYRLQTKEIDAWITKVRPGVELVMEQGPNAYTIKAEAESGTYNNHNMGDDDYVDYRLDLIGNWEFDIRNRFELAAHHRRAHDDRGMGRMDVPTKLAGIPGGQFAEPDKWHSNGVYGKYNFGAPDAKGALEIYLSTEDKDYINNGPSTDPLDRQEHEGRIMGLLKVRPRTSLLLEVRGKQIEYDVQAPVTRDSEDIRYYVGVEWEATAKTTGSIRLGYQDKEPEDNTGVFSDFSATAWETQIIWSPKTYSAIEFTAFRGAQDSSDALSFVDREIYSLAWLHDWSERLSSRIYATTDQQDYEGATRDDQVDSWGFGATYEATDWLNVVGDYRYEDRESSTVGLDFERNVVLFGLELEFD